MARQYILHYPVIMILGEDTPFMNEINYHPDGLKCLPIKTAYLHYIA